MQPLNYMKNELFFAFFWVTASFFLYWPWFFHQIKGKRTNGILLIRLYGALIFGGVPLFVFLFSGFSLTNLGLALPSGSMVWTVVALATIPLSMLVSWIQSARPAALIDYPQIRESVWSYRLMGLNILTWMIYLVGYEILFRGLLLFPVLDELGITLAFVLNVGFYSLTHASKNFTEGLSTIPIGILLALIAWKTESIVFPVIIHWSMAVSNSVFTFYRHPEMRLRTRS